MEKLYYSYEELLKDSKELIRILEGEYDAVLAVARGGMTFAHLLSEGLDIRDVNIVKIASYDDTVQRDSVTISDLPELDENKRYLIVEDIVDSGKSMKALSCDLSKHYPDLNYDVAVLFYKKSACYTPKYYLHEAKSWIEFFWDVDI
jgi:xanthine phosphoribosyltransferase